VFGGIPVGQAALRVPAFPVEPLERKSAEQVCVILFERRRVDPVDRCELVAGFRFSPREREVVRYLTSGLTTKEIALRMNISPNTVKQYVRLAMSKVGTTTRSRMVANILSA
jgi:DNA-binding CsgD family transcriptional regulator